MEEPLLGLCHGHMFIGGLVGRGLFGGLDGAGIGAVVGMIIGMNLAMILELKTKKEGYRLAVVWPLGALTGAFVGIIFGVEDGAILGGALASTFSGVSVYAFVVRWKEGKKKEIDDQTKVEENLVGTERKEHMERVECFRCKVDNPVFANYCYNCGKKIGEGTVSFEYFLALNVLVEYTIQKERSTASLAEHR